MTNDTTTKPSTILERLNEVMDVKPTENLPVPVQDLKLEDDFEYSREKLKSIVDTGEAAIEELAGMCGELENPIEAYSSLAKLIVAASDATKKIMDINKDKAEITNAKAKDKTNVENNYIQNNFVGTVSAALEQEDPITLEPEEIEEDE